MRSFFVSSAGSSFAWNKKPLRLAEMNKYFPNIVEKHYTLQKMVLGIIMAWVFSSVVSTTVEGILGNHLSVFKSHLSLQNNPRVEFE